LSYYDGATCEDERELIISKGIPFQQRGAKAGELTKLIKLIREEEGDEIYWKEKVEFGIQRYFQSRESGIGEISMNSRKGFWRIRKDLPLCEEGWRMGN